jgi:hypothetical protein
LSRWTGIQEKRRREAVLKQREARAAAKAKEKDREEQRQVIRDALLELGVDLLPRARRIIAINFDAFYTKVLPVIQKGKTR